MQARKLGVEKLKRFLGVLAKVSASASKLSTMSTAADLQKDLPSKSFAAAIDSASKLKDCLKDARLGYLKGRMQEKSDPPLDTLSGGVGNGKSWKDGLDATCDPRAVKAHYAKTLAVMPEKSLKKLSELADQYYDVIVSYKFAQEMFGVESTVPDDEWYPEFQRAVVEALATISEGKLLHACIKMHANPIALRSFSSQLEININKKTIYADVNVWNAVHAACQQIVADAKSMKRTRG
jgi:hypothetical protein